MAAVVAEVVPLLKSAGFRKRRNAFNRITEPGLVQVVSFQMGEFMPGSLYGRFTINLGVYVPEMVLDEHAKRGDWVKESSCQLRQRIGLLLTPPEDVWWPLDDPTEAAGAARDALANAGLPWLDRLASRQAILDAYELLGWAAIGMSPRGPVEIAWLVKGEDRERAEAILRDYMQEPFLNPGHWEPLSRWLQAGGFEHLFDEPPTH